MEYEWIAPCHFGMEAVCKKEITDLGYEIVHVEDGKVTFRGGPEAGLPCEYLLAHGGASPAEGGKLPRGDL